jgi:hypothetical protein
MVVSFLITGIQKAKKFNIQDLLVVPSKLFVCFLAQQQLLAAAGTSLTSVSGTYTKIVIL